MKMTNFVLINLMNTLQVYAEKKLPQKISYAITRNVMNIAREYQIYESQLKKIFDEYSEYMIKDDKGEIKVNRNAIPIVEEIVSKEFNQQIEDLLNIKINVDMYFINSNNFDYEDNGHYDAMSANDIMILQSILCEPEKDKSDNESNKS